MKTTKFFVTILVAGLLTCPATIEAQRAQKKHRDAPNETIILMIGNPNITFDESQFPNLRFFYLPGVAIEQSSEERRVLGVTSTTTVTTYKGAPDFITRWGSKMHLAGDDFIYLLLIDKEGTVAYQKSYHESLAKSGAYGYEWNLLSAPRKRPDKETLEEYLRIHIRREKPAKINKRKSYTEGQEPDFRGWEDGDIEGMELPDFIVQTADGNKLSMKDIISGNPSIIVFSKLDSEKNYASGDEAAEKLKSGEVESRQEFRKAFLAASQPDAWPMPMMWHIEDVLYNYRPRD